VLAGVRAKHRPNVSALRTADLEATSPSSAPAEAAANSLGALARFATAPPYRQQPQKRWMDSLREAVLCGCRLLAALAPQRFGRRFGLPWRRFALGLDQSRDQLAHRLRQVEPFAAEVKRDVSALAASAFLGALA
jgi:hypothetical protein